jgi:hypothetical protein
MNHPRENGLPRRIILCVGLKNDVQSLDIID